MVMTDSRFEMRVDGVTYMVTAEPFAFNEETRYKLRYNGGKEHIFTWDSSIGRLTALDDEALTLPDDLEVVIAQRLQSGR